MIGLVKVDQLITTAALCGSDCLSAVGYAGHISSCHFQKSLVAATGTHGTHTMSALLDIWLHVSDDIAMLYLSH